MIGPLSYLLGLFSGMGLIVALGLYIVRRRDKNAAAMRDFFEGD